jgi:AcrR family transcriptional regulator
MKQERPLASVAEPASTRDRILDAAESRFAERGFAGAAVRDIAAAAGLNAASLYNHFPGKEELYEAVLERGLRPVVELLDALASTEDGADRYAPIDAVVAHFAASPNLARLIQQDVLGGGERVVRIAGRLLGPI